MTCTLSFDRKCEKYTKQNQKNKKKVHMPLESFAYYSAYVAFRYSAISALSNISTPVFGSSK